MFSSPTVEKIFQKNHDNSTKKGVFGQLNPLEKCFKIWYVYEKRKTTWFFSFFILSNFHFSLINALVYVDIDQGIHKGKMKVAQNETVWVFFFHKHTKF